MKQPISEIKVGLDFGKEVLPAGHLAAREGVIYFEYHASFIQHYSTTEMDNTIHL